MDIVAAVGTLAFIIVGVWLLVAILSLTEGWIRDLLGKPPAALDVKRWR